MILEKVKILIRKYFFDEKISDLNKNFDIFAIFENYENVKKKLFKILQFEIFEYGFDFFDG